MTVEVHICICYCIPLALRRVSLILHNLAKTSLIESQSLGDSSEHIIPILNIEIKHS